VISELLSALLPPLAAKATVHCILEQPVPNALNGEAGSTRLVHPSCLLLNCQQQHTATASANAVAPVTMAAGKFSWFQSGYAYGVWNGVLANFSMRKQVICRVQCRASGLTIQWPDQGLSL
jgi:hypothetical protein